MRFLTVARVVRAHGIKGELSCEIVTDFPERFRKTTRVYLSPPPRRPEPVRPTPVAGPARRPGGRGSASRGEAGGAAKRVSAAGDAPGGPVPDADAPKPAVTSVAPAEASVTPTEVFGAGGGEPDAANEASPSPRAYRVERARVVPHARGALLVLGLETVGDREAADALRDWLVQVPEDEAWTLPKGQYYWHQIVGLAVVTSDGRRLGSVVEILETGANDVYVVKRERGEELLLPAIKDVVREIAPERGEMVVALLSGME